MFRVQKYKIPESILIFQGLLYMIHFPLYFDDQVNLAFYEDEMRRYFANIIGKGG